MNANKSFAFASMPSGSSWPNPEEVIELGLDPDGAWITVKWSNTEFVVTHDAIPAKYREIPPELEERYEGLHNRAINSPDGVLIDELAKLVDQFPNVAPLKNLLRAAYVQTNRIEEANELEQRAFREHPNYLFAQLDNFHKVIDEKGPDEALNSIGGRFDLVKLQNGRRVFHLSELTAFFMAYAYYATVKGLPKSVQAIEKMLDTINPSHPHSDTLQAYQLRALLKSTPYTPPWNVPSRKPKTRLKRRK